jgi:hypothetical protein
MEQRSFRRFPALVRTSHLLLACLCLLLLMSCSEEDPPESDGSPAAASVASIPTPVAEVRDEVIDACDKLALDFRSLAEVFLVLREPGVAPKRVVEQLQGVESAFVEDAAAFEKSGEIRAAGYVSKVADAIGALTAAIESSGSIQTGLRLELANLEGAMSANVKMGHTCPS